MKILFVSHQSDFIYGGETVTLSFIQGLKKLGHEPVVACPKGPLMTYFQKAQIQCFTSPMIEINRKSIFQLQFYLTFWHSLAFLMHLIHREKIDVIHAISLKATVYVFPLGLYWNIFWHHHNIMKPTWFHRVSLKFLSLFCRRILVPSHATKNSLIACTINAEKIRTVHNGINPDDFSDCTPIKLKAKDYLHILYIGELSYRKGIDLLPAIMEKIGYEIPTVKLSIVGGKTSEPEFADHWIQVFRSNQFIEYVGQQANVVPFLQKADILLVPSREDPFPTVVLEAMFSQTVVVASDVGGIHEMIENNRTGILVENESIAGFANAVKKLVQNQELLAELCTNAYTKAIREFTTMVAAQKLETVYQEFTKNLD